MIGLPAVIFLFPLKISGTQPKVSQVHLLNFCDKPRDSSPIARKDSIFFQQPKLLFSISFSSLLRLPLLLPLFLLLLLLFSFSSPSFLFSLLFLFHSYLAWKHHSETTPIHELKSTELTVHTTSTETLSAFKGFLISLHYYTFLGEVLLIAGRVLCASQTSSPEDTGYRSSPVMPPLPAASPGQDLTFAGAPRSLPTGPSPHHPPNPRASPPGHRKPTRSRDEPGGLPAGAQRLRGTTLPGGLGRGVKGGRAPGSARRRPR